MKLLKGPRTVLQSHEPFPLDSSFLFQHFRPWWGKWNHVSLEGIGIGSVGTLRSEIAARMHLPISSMLYMVVFMLKSNPTYLFCVLRVLSASNATQMHGYTNCTWITSLSHPSRSLRSGFDANLGTPNISLIISPKTVSNCIWIVSNYVPAYLSFAVDCRVQVMQGLFWKIHAHRWQAYTMCWYTHPIIGITQVFNMYSPAPPCIAWILIRIFSNRSWGFFIF